MKITTKAILIHDNAISVGLPLQWRDELEQLQKALIAGKTFDVEITIHREKRSLNANAALWAMLGDMARALNTTAEELYIIALRDYGVSYFTAVCPEDTGKVVATNRIVEKRGVKNINGFVFDVLQVWAGSSTYNTRQFAALLDGVISDAKDLGVPYISAADRDLLLQDWGRKK